MYRSFLPVPSELRRTPTDLRNLPLKSLFGSYPKPQMFPDAEGMGQNNQPLNELA